MLQYETHYLYMKEEENKDVNQQTNKVLQSINVPPNA